MTTLTETAQMTDTNSIEKEITLRAPRAKVWRALTDAQEFGAWFGVTLDGAFKPGQPIHGRMTNPKYAHIDFEFVVETIAPQELFSYRWHPYAIAENVDFSQEQKTLVEFHLSDTPDGTMLRVIESGFDHIPAGRRAEAFLMNGKGWTAQVENIRRYVEK
ncbi:MAG: SRPBCC family protein [Gemmatimonadota bacterium]|nr:SRPBCC family protein [Gemmatimonadota bacterium]